MKKAIVFCILLLFTSHCIAATITVEADASGDYPTIQAAIDAAVNGDEVVAGPGTYTGPGNRDIDFLGKAITVRSETGPENTIIDCNGFCGFEFWHHEDANSILDGVTIENTGDAISCDSSGPTINNCIITKSFWRAIECHYAAPHITNTIITANSSEAGSVMYFVGSDISMENCSITLNSSSGYFDSGAISSDYSTLNITNCNITDNACSGIVCGTRSNLKIINSTISRNSANIARDSAAGISCRHGGNAEITNCLITDNSGTDYASAGGIYCDVDNTKITNCTIIGNTVESSSRPGGIRSSGNTEITNCIVRGNNNAQIDGPAIVTFSNVEGYWPGTGNFDADPGFAFSTDYHLMPGSACIDTGTNSVVPPLPATDMEGNPRIVNGIVDMGAYEFNPDSPAVAASAATTSFILKNGSVSIQEPLLIRNCGGGTLNWQIFEDCNWVELSQTNGSSDGEINEVTMTIDPAGLEAGYHQAVLVIDDPGASNSPVEIRITLKVGDVLHVTGDYPTIQAAIDAAEDGDTVIVAPGTYTGGGNRDIDFKGKAITVKSETGPENTIIDCDSSTAGFYFENYEDATSVLDGFTITDADHAIYCNGGSTPVIENCIITKNTFSDGDGAGVYCSSSNPLITNCTFTSNKVQPGGSSPPHNWPYEFSNSWPYTPGTLPPGGGGLGCGGAIYCRYSSNPVITNCTFTNNTAKYGGAIYCRSGDPVITNCTFTNNTAQNGGAIYCYDESSIAMTNCIITRNRAVSYAPIYIPDELETGADLPETSADSSSINGGAIYIYSDCELSLTNCSVSNNFAEDEGGAIYVRYSGSPITVTNSIIWDNSEPRIIGTANLTYCNVQGGYQGEGNIDIEPLLTWSGHLQADSPCIDTGDPNYVPVPGETDLDGESRVMNGRIDIGPDEFLDTDSDTLADWWEYKYFGDTNGIGPDDNPDSDDWINIYEYLYDTEPNTIPDTYYVDPCSGSDSYDGLAPLFDGTHGPKLRIQPAIDQCRDRYNDTVILAPATYIGDENTRLMFYGKAITVRSTAPDDPNIVEATIIDCQNYYHAIGFLFHSCESPASVITGMTVTNGYDPQGGAIYCDNASPTISNCRLIANKAREYGGAIYCNRSNPVITNCYIADNSSQEFGGAIYSVSSNPVIKDCYIADNSSLLYGGAIYNYDNSNLLISDSIITGNVVGHTAAGIYCRQASLTIDRSMIVGNVNLGLSRYGAAGGVYCYRGEMTISNSLIAGNKSKFVTIYVSNTNMSLTNSTIIENKADLLTGGVWVVGESDTIITNCIIRDNISAEPNQMVIGYPNSSNPDAPSVLIDYSDIQHGVYISPDCTINWGENNIDADPYFVSPGYWDGDIWAEGDYHLLGDSPCIDTGDPNYIPATGETDLDGIPRVMGGRIDMGAYEVLGPLDLLAQLAESIDAMGLHKGTANSLLAKLNTAIKKLQDDNEKNDIAAENALQAFINAVEAQSGKKIPESDADALITAAQQILDLLTG